eukprot:3622111-Prymnesium_polylepis.1
MEPRTLGCKHRNFQHQLKKSLLNAIAAALLTERRFGLGAARVSAFRTRCDVGNRTILSHEHNLEQLGATLWRGQTNRIRTATLSVITPLIVQLRSCSPLPKRSRRRRALSSTALLASVELPVHLSSTSKVLTPCRKAVSDVGGALRATATTLHSSSHLLHYTNLAISGVRAGPASSGTANRRRSPSDIATKLSYMCVGWKRCGRCVVVWRSRTAALRASSTSSDACASRGGPPALSDRVGKVPGDVALSDHVMRPLLPRSCAVSPCISPCISPFLRAQHARGGAHLGTRHHAHEHDGAQQGWR